MGDRGKHEKAAQSERRSAGHGYAPVPGEIGPADVRGEQARGERQLLPLDQPPGQDGPAWSDLSIEQRRPYLDVIARTSLSGPELAAANWAVLDPVERQAWIHERPAVVGNTDGIDGQPLLLMSLASDGNGRAVIAMNNPDTATDVATLVPGTGAKLTGISRDVQRNSRMFHAAKDAGSDSTSVITWYGYDAPQSVVPGAASKAHAREAAPTLCRFLDGLRATHEGPRSHHTLIGHSYGTTVIGAAAAEGGRGVSTDDIILVASPGTRARTAVGLKINGVPDGDQGQHVFATTARLDPIRAVPPVHGRQPVQAQFGATIFRSASGDWNLIRNHGAYWRPRNPALRNMGRIIAGRGDRVSR